MGNPLNRGHCFVLTTTGNEELGRFVQCKEKETTKESNECDGSKRQYKVSPTPVVCLGASRIAFARKVGDESPSKHTISESESRSEKVMGNHGPGNQSTNGPPSGQSAENTAGIGRQTFQEHGSIDRQVTTDTKTQAGIKRTCSTFDISLFNSHANV